MCKGVQHSITRPFVSRERARSTYRTWHADYVLAEPGKSPERGEFLTGDNEDLFEVKRERGGHDAHPLAAGSTAVHTNIPPFPGI